MKPAKKKRKTTKIDWKKVWKNVSARDRGWLIPYSSLWKREREWIQEAVEAQLREKK